MMRGIPEVLIQKLIRLAQNLTSDRLQHLSGKFLKSEECPGVGVMDTWMPNAGRSSDLKEVAKLWQENNKITGELISSFLQGAWYSWQASMSDQQMHMLITGPRTLRNTIRSLASEIYCLIGRANKSLLLTTYNANPPSELIDALSAAEDRGVEIELVFESKISDSKISRLIEVLKKVSAYQWPQENRPETHSEYSPSFHAKFVLADDEHLVVSSANLTGYALDKNIELGVLISGGDQPKSVRRYYDELIREGHLEKYTSSTTD